MTASFSMLARMLVLAALVLLAPGPIRLVHADEASGALARTHQDIGKVFGKVPDFLKVFPDDGLPRRLGRTQGRRLRRRRSYRKDKGTDRACGRGADSMPVLHLG
ncbi:hypothetical protein SAMN03159463_01664 [Mesorhizobium sp. NFR06]|nr:hypothetical protein SAMN03159463_01664 [Mesorhizobium sp. NFR06]